MAQAYVDDIVFRVTIDAQAIKFSKEMKKEFEMSMVGELTFFLGLQVKQKKEDRKSTRLNSSHRR